MKALESFWEFKSLGNDKKRFIIESGLVGQKGCFAHDG